MRTGGGNCEDAIYYTLIEPNSGMFYHQVVEKEKNSEHRQQGRYARSESRMHRLYIFYQMQRIRA